MGATDYYNRLAQRVTAALSVPTAAGPLYDVDTRLRPQGAKGMLAVSLGAFAAYQQDEAWTWEHMALTRGRAVYGSAEARSKLANILDTILQRPRDSAVLSERAVAGDESPRAAQADELERQLHAPWRHELRRQHQPHCDELRLDSRHRRPP